MSRQHHPLFLGPSGTKLKGVKVRHKTTGAVGRIAYVERRRNPEEPPKLWIIYPPQRLPDGNRFKIISAGSAYINEVKRIRRKK